MTAYDAAGNCASTAIDTYVDRTAPVISEVKIVEKDSSGYTIECKPTDNNMTVLRVQFPTWTEKDGQDDLAAAWWESEAVKGVKNGDTWRFRINISEHNNETGKYTTHIYAYDSCKNQSQPYEVSVFIEEDNDDTTDVEVPDNSSDINNMENKDNAAITNDTTNTNTENTKSQILPVGAIVADATTFGKYKVTSSNTNNPTVTYIKTESKMKKVIKIREKVTVGGIEYKVTAIADNAFKNNKNLTSVEIGKNVTKIGKNVFNGCKNLKKITIKSKKLKSVGKNAFKGIHKKCKIKVPSSKLKAYKKLLKKKGQKSTVKITK